MYRTGTRVFINRRLIYLRLGQRSETREDRGWSATDLVTSNNNRITAVARAGRESPRVRVDPRRRYVACKLELQSYITRSTQYNMVRSRGGRVDVGRRIVGSWAGRGDSGSGCSPRIARCVKLCVQVPCDSSNCTYRGTDRTGLISIFHKFSENK